MARQEKKARAVCPECGKPGMKWNPLPHDHTTPITKKETDA